jgi:hypothetical protein
MCAPDAHQVLVQSAVLVALGTMPAFVRAADAEVLDEDFLDYLAEFEDEDDDWSWFDGDDKPSPPKRSSDATRNDKAKEKVQP